MDLHPVILVAAIVLALVVLELCLYAIPLRLRVRMDYANGAGMAFISACWLCLGVRSTLAPEGRTFHLLLGGLPLPLPAFLGSYAPGGRRPGNMAFQEPEDLPASSYIQSAVPYVPHLISFARAAVRSLSFRRLDCRAVVGLSGPAETGMLYGYFWAAKPLLCSTGRINLEMVPDFTREHLEGHLELDVNISYPFNLLARLVRLFTLFQENKTHCGKSGVPA
jgi:hypothetical protein